MLQDDEMHLLTSGKDRAGWKCLSKTVGTGEPFIFLNQNCYTCKQLCQALFSQEAYFLEAIQAPPHIQMGWQVKKSRRRGRGGADILIDGPMARGDGWVYEPEQIWILRTRPSCHTGHIKSYLTMHYVGDLSRKKDEHALPCGWNYNLLCSEE